jgi:hypothetical protein
MQVRPIKTNEVFPPPISRSAFSTKLPGYAELVKKIRQGTIPENGVVLQLDQNDVKAVGAKELSKVVSRVVARLKKECEKCYREEGGTKGRNLQIYAAGDQVIVRKLDEKDKGGHLFSPRGQAACRESRNGKVLNA